MLSKTSSHRAFTITNKGAPWKDAPTIYHAIFLLDNRAIRKRTKSGGVRLNQVLLKAG
jgi:hypothetical protein